MSTKKIPMYSSLLSSWNKNVLANFLTWYFSITPKYVYKEQLCSFCLVHFANLKIWINAKYTRWAIHFCSGLKRKILIYDACSISFGDLSPRESLLNIFCAILVPDLHPLMIVHLHKPFFRNTSNVPWLWQPSIYFRAAIESISRAAIVMTLNC